MGAGQEESELLVALHVADDEESPVHGEFVVDQFWSRTRRMGMLRLYVGEHNGKRR